MPDNTNPIHDHSSLSPWTQAINDHCRQFQQNWIQGTHPRIEDFLTRLPDAARDQLLLELILQEINLLKKSGSYPDRDHYLQRFPSQQPLVDRAFSLAKESFHPHDKPSTSPLPNTPQDFPTEPYPGNLSPRTPPPPNERYRTIRLHAKGGLGEVFLAKDHELNREVALKEIQDRYADTEESRARFRLEAEITGNLEHPGIVPVYGFGQYADGRPYYAMRFIRGESLKEAVDDFHAKRRSSLIPNLVGLELRRLLRRFVDVCNAMEYAHSRGVLHRDLKPGNIILGKYGETLVVDWGLAKAQGDSESTSNPNPPVVPASRGDNTPTMMGSALGTPAYMSPEQAAGRIDELAPATDVYSLGATLFQLLTGEAPIQGSSALDIIEKAATGNIRLPHDVCSEVPKSLDAVCRKAMAHAPSQRYSSPLLLADEIERWLADEPVLAYREPWVLRAKRWVRAHPTLVSTSVVASTLALAAASAIALINNQHAKVVSLKNQTLAQQNNTILQQKDHLESQNAELVVAQQAAILEQTKAQSVTEFLVDSFRKIDPDQDGKNLTVYDSLIRAQHEIESQDSLPPLVKASILSAMYKTFQQLGMFSESFHCAELAHDLCTTSLQPHQEQRLLAQADLASATREMGKLEPAFELASKTFEQAKASLGPSHRVTMQSRNDLACLLLDQGNFPNALPLLQASFEDRLKEYGPQHHLTLLAQNNLACCYAGLGHADQAIPLYVDTIQRRIELYGESHSTTLLVQDNLLKAYLDIGRYQPAIDLAQQILQVRSAKLGDQHPNTLESYLSLASAFAQAGLLDQAIPRLEKIAQAMREHYGETHPQTLLCLNNLAESYRENQQPELAIPILESNLKLNRSALGENHPKTIIGMSNLSLAYMESGQAERAVPIIEEGYRRITAALGQDHPSVLIYQGNWGNILLAAGCIEEGKQQLFDRLSRTKSMAGDNPQKWIPFATRFAEKLISSQQFTDAETLLREILATVEPSEPNSYNYHLAQALLGLALSHSEHPTEASSLLIAGFQGIEKASSSSNPNSTSPDQRDRLALFAERLVFLLQKSDPSDQLALWQQRLDALKQNQP